MFLSKILIHSCMITYYIVEENIFTVIVHKFLDQKTHCNDILKTALKLVVNNRLRCQRKANMLDSKLMREK